MFSDPGRRLEALLEDHGLAAREFVDRARAIDATRWLTPRAEGKWTPAQETQHVILSYREFLRQLRETTPMRPRGSSLRRRVARLYGLTSILWRKRIPVAVRAPSEVRPDAVVAPAAELLPMLEGLVREFEQAFRATWRDQPRRRMSHYLFGNLTLDQGIRLVTVHTRHHAAFLPAAATARAGNRPSPSIA